MQPNKKLIGSNKKKKDKLHNQQQKDSLSTQAMNRLKK